MMCMQCWGLEGREEQGWEEGFLLTSPSSLG